MRFVICLYLGICILFLAPIGADASEEITISPVVINEKGYARDVVEKEITITNNGDSRVTLWPFTFDVDAVEGAQEIKAPAASDRSSSLSSWLEIPRGAISLDPGESETLTLTIRVNLSAKPGTYNTRLVFASGHKSNSAENKVLSSPYTLINFEILEEIKEHINLVTFAPEKVFSSGFPVSFNYELENTGNRPQEPKGEIIIYNRRGKEVASVPVNLDGSGVAENESISIASAWQGPNAEGGFLMARIASSAGGFGRYKAFLNIEYGTNGQYKIQDTVFFWVVPLYALAAVFVLLLFSALYTANFLHKRQAQYVKEAVLPSEPEKDFVIDMRNRK